MVAVIWHGHACFEVRGEDGTVVTDPFTGVGLPEPSAKADLVLCSHSHGDHNNARAVKKPDGVVLEGFVGPRRVGRIEARGVATYHDEAKGSQRGRNSVCVFTVDGLNFCHLGDLGHDLNRDDVKAVGAIDVLFTPVGGIYTIGPETAASLCKKLKPSVVVPMHYRMPGMSSTFDRLSTVEDFLKVYGTANVIRVKKPAYTITKETLPKEQTVVVLSLR